MRGRAGRPDETLPKQRQIILHGYRFSAYTRIARIVLEEKGVEYTMFEVDPFSEDLPETFLRLHPFGRVPALSHAGFVVYETSAIERYIDAAFPIPALTPDDPAGVTRMAQVIAIVDNYGYWPMVRQVFSHRIFRPLVGERTCEREIRSGIDASRKALSALEVIAAEGQILNGNRFTLADCHLAPMIDYFVAAPEGAELLAEFPRLSDWWAGASRRPSVVRTDPGRPRDTV